MLTFIWAIIIGFIIGAIAKFLMPGNQPGGFIITVILGIAGSSFATWMGQVLHIYQPGQSAGFIFSIVGAIIILFIYKKIVEVTSNRSTDI
ncbi:hypothetical protein COMNV_01267 [Commensalibacter sp. Nvir]|uniref:GlsB/YeaQ/YmgE family stress response membrane protein n=1 Tax=Commensalibacter sp. Nvir TaxID=3069817 RepID=UPI002D6513AD|nr:hypothetical protein COMNV_01267 [Commensalibacter sp. Nvir]